MGELKPRIKMRSGWWVVDLPLPPERMTGKEKWMFREAYTFCDELNRGRRGR